MDTRGRAALRVGRPAAAECGPFNRLGAAPARLPLLTGLYLFVLTRATKWRGGRRTGG
jgi:hypothetical protein